MRAGLIALGFFGLVFLPPFVPALCILALSLRYRAWEAIVLGLCMDFVWHPIGGWPIFMIGSIIVVWVLEPVRMRLLS